MEANMMAWHCEDDSDFVRRAVIHFADLTGKDAKTAKFSDFGPRIQSAILQKAQEFKLEGRI
jgi:hypothetical protein